MKKNRNRYIDLSDIKDDDLDKTASFTDLMSRSEKKEHERKKIEEETQKLKEILMNDEDKKELKKREKKKKKESRKREIENKKIEERKENIESNLSKTQKIIDLTNEIKLSMLNNVEENINTDDKEEKKFKIGNIVVTDFLIIISLAYYIYTIIFTNINISQLYLLIGGAIIISMIFLFCLSIISKRILSKIFSILIYLIFIGYILFNLILVFGIIKL